MTRPVVVGIDGSPTGQLALDWAAAEAVRRARPLHLLHAYGWPFPDIPQLPEAYMSRFGRDVQAAGAQLLEIHAVAVSATNPELTVTTQLSGDLPSAALLAAARTAATVVVGSRGLGGFAGLLVGSVSVQVATHAECPVVVVRRTRPTAGDLLVGVDRAEPADAILDYAFQQAAWQGKRLVAVHAWRWPEQAEPGDVLSPVFDPDSEQARQERFLADILAGWQEKYAHVPVQQRVVRGRPGRVLAEASRHATLTVVGSSRHSTTIGLLLGSVSQFVLHHAGSPVAVVHPD